MAGGGSVAEGSQYSPLTGLIYIFNLIVGTGALTLPAAFHDAGWALSSAIVIVLAFMSYLTATFVVESMASANAVNQFKRQQRLKKSDGSGPVPEQLRDFKVEVLTADRNQSSSPLHRPTSSLRPTTDDREQQEEQEENETQPLIDQEAGASYIPPSYYEITSITEMGKMSSMFFSRTGRNLFYLCLVIYLYGDLAIYAAAVSKSIRDVACTFRPDNASSPLNISELEKCKDNFNVTRLDTYRIVLTLFVLVIGQFVFCNVTKTKYLQMVTTLMRWLAFGIMVVLACVNISKERPNLPTPPTYRIAGLPNLFGVCVYSFMCHHSLPSLITPITRKKYLYQMMLGDYILILSFYFLLAFTGIFAFKEINDLYTLNFQPSESDGWFMYTLHIFLALFPVFTLSTNFPIIAITLSNNLKALFLTEGRRYSWLTRVALFPLLSLVPPTCVAMATHSLEFLVGITGSYAGTGIQYVVPALLVYHARQESSTALGVGVKNQHMSPFRSVYWVVFVILWAATCIIFVTWNHIAGE